MTLLHQIQHQVRRFFPKGQQATHATSSRNFSVPMYDVTQFASKIDLSYLKVIEDAPMWMTRAERLLIYTLTFCLRPTRYLEIGTFQGGSALVVCAALDALQSDGKMICVDPNPQIAPEHWQRLEHRAQLLTGYSPQILGEAEEKAGGKFDLVLIDGDHTYAGALRDAQGVLPFVTAGSYLLFHDCFFSEVAQAVDDFVAEHSNRLVDFGLLTRETTVHQEPDGKRVNWGGLRMVQVTKDLSH